MAVNLSPVGGVAGQFFDNNGNPLSGGKIFTYSAGTTTNQVTYTNATGAIAHANPIILDSAGRVPSGEIWLTDGLQYKFVITDSNNVLIGTYDNIVGINSNFVNFTNEQELQTATAGQTVFTLTTMQYQPATNSLSVFVDGVNQYGPGALYAYVETDSTTVTFTTGLHVGAEVKFTTSNLNSSAGGDAFNVSYTPPFTGSVATNVGDKLAQTVSVKDFGAVGDGVTNDAPAVQLAVNSGAKSIYFPEGVYLFNSNSVASGEGACVILTSLHHDVQFTGEAATIKSATNKLQLFCINGADNVSIRGLIFDNSANGLLQNQVKPAGYGVPDGGILGNGNSANAAISLFDGEGLTVENCSFKEFSLGVYYICDYTDDQILGGHLYSNNNAFYGCVQGHLIDTPESYEIVNCRAYDNDDSVNADASIDPGHLIYVTNRNGAVPQNGVVTNIFDTRGKSSAIKIRKGRSLAVSNFVSYLSERGIEIWNVQEGAVTNVAVTLGVATISTNSAFEITDCGGLRVSNCLLDIRNRDAWGFRIRRDISPAYGNKNWSIANVTILADYTSFTGKAAILIDQQSHYSVENAKWVVEGAVKNNRRFLDVRGSDYGFIADLSAIFYDTATSEGFVTFDATSDNNTALIDYYAGINSTIGVLYGDAGTGNVVSHRSIDDGTAAKPSLSFVNNRTTGMYSPGANVVGFAANGQAVAGASAGTWRPLADGTISLGSSAFKWSQVFAANGTINTSDANEKQQIRLLTDAEKAVALRLKSLIRAFKFNEAVNRKGDTARTHIGVIAQDVQAAFAAEGLDANNYGVFCADLAETGETKLGVRYGQLFAFILGAL
jgi:hypothetical protein